MPLRPHQQKFNQICQDINAGSPVRDILVYAKPGSGKSAYPSIASQLIHDDRTKILWICPRDALVDQAESDFRGADIFDVGDMDIRAAGNKGNPFRGNVGAVTTYQAVIAQPERWIRIAKEYKLILFLDEFDSLTESKAWAGPIQEIYDLSFIRISATGTIDRSDELPISFVPYLPDGNIDFSDTDTRRWIIYGTEEAIRDGSIIAFDATLISGSGSYIDLDGITRNFSKFTGKGDELVTAFKTEFAFQMFRLCVSDWQEFRADHPWAKMLIIANNIEVAEKYNAWFRAEGYRFNIATSGDESLSKETIRRYKLPNSHYAAYDGMVSVGKAYKGLDVKAATFLVFLTRIRGKSWCDQAIGRIQRSFPGKTKGFLYAPDDPKLRVVLKQLACGHINAATADPEPQGNSAPPEETGPARTIQALSSRAHLPETDRDPDLFTPEVPRETQSETEMRLRREINNKIKSVFGAESNGNKKVKQRIFYLRVGQIVNHGRDEAGKIIRKKIEEMTVPELKKVADFAKLYK